MQLFVIFVTMFKLLALPAIAFLGSSIESERVADIQTPVCDSVYTFAEVQPQYPGGMKGFYDFLKGFTYEEIGPEDPIYGKFNIHLTLDQTGVAKDIQVTPETDPGLALKTFLKKMQAWTPAKNKDVPVCYYFKIPAVVHYR